MKEILFFLTLSIFVITACNSRSAGSTSDWIELFDGKSLNHWRTFQTDTIRGWIVEDGCLTPIMEQDNQSGDIITRREFKNFELALEWKISKGGNSGIMFHVVEEGHETTFETGPEYQVLDDEGFPSQLEDWQKTGANYAMHVAQNKTLKPAGEFNTSRIIVDNGHVEHWLNGEKVVEYELWSDDWYERKQTGKWKDYPDYGMAGKGHLALQYHGSKVWYRNIKLRVLPKKNNPLAACLPVSSSATPL